MKKLPRYLTLLPHVALAICAGVWAADAWTDDAATEPSVARAFQDKRLAWGPCPPFLPAGCAIAVLHGDPAKPNVDVFFKVPPGSKIPAHTHTSPERMVLVSGVLDVKYQGQPAITLKPGMYAYGPAGRPHEATCHSGVSCVLFIGFEAPLDAAPYTSEVK